MDDKSRIEELKKSLYSRTAPDVRTRRKLRYSDMTTNVRTDWEHPPEEDVRPAELNQKYEDHHMSFFAKLLIASAVFCVVAVGIGAYLFFNGSNLISADNIAIQISGPVSISGGEPVNFDITAINKNNVNLRLVDMMVDFPAGTTDPGNPGQVLSSYRKMIGDVPAGGSVKESVQAVIFGEENLQKEITVTLTYSITGSTAVFTKTQTYDVLIKSSPLNVTVDSLKEITSGQQFPMKVTVKSNSKQTLKNVLLKAAYPFGFNFVSSSLPSLSGNATWKIGDIPPGAERTITIQGTLTGEDTDIRAFHFNVGAQSASNPGNIGTEYMSLEQDVSIQKPFISLAMTIDNDKSLGDYIGTFDRSEHVQIDWMNNLPSAVSNLVITLKLSGSAYDKSSVQPDAGYFDSAHDQIVWNQMTNPELAKAAAGDSGSVSFTITPKASSASVVNPVIGFSASVSGNRAQESNVPEKLSEAVTRTTRLASSISLSGRVVRTIGPFANTGPVPPQSEKTTTYTVVWDVDNTSNSVGNAVVTATLPPYVKWLNVVSPSNENITYDQNSGEVTWNVGSIGTYTLGSSQRREAAFQISLTPGANQISQTPILVNISNLTGTDNFTGASLKSSQGNLTTRYSTDPGYKQGDELVAK